MIDKIWTVLKKSMYGSSKSCFLQHQIAASELNCYDEIMSESVEEHVEKCSKFVLKLSKDKQDKTEWVPVPASYMHLEMMGSTVYIPGSKTKAFDYTNDRSDAHLVNVSDWQMDLTPPQEWDVEEPTVEAAGARHLTPTLCPNAPYGGTAHEFAEVPPMLSSFGKVIFCTNCGYRPTKLDAKKFS